MADQTVVPFQPQYSAAPQTPAPQQQYIPPMQASPQTAASSYVPPQQSYMPQQQAPMGSGLGSYFQQMSARNAAPRPSYFTASTGAPSTGAYSYNPATKAYTQNQPSAPTQQGQPLGQLGGWKGSGLGNGPLPEYNSGGNREFASGGSVSPQGLASLGRGQDSMLVHMTPGEVDGLQKLAMAAGGSLTINPHTGLAEAGFLSSMLPMLAAAAAIYFTGGAAAPAVEGAMGAGAAAGGAAAGGAGLFGMGAGATGALAGGATGYLMDPQHKLSSAISGGLSGYGVSGMMGNLAQAGNASLINEPQIAAENMAQANLANTQLASPATKLPVGMSLEGQQAAINKGFTDLSSAQGWGNLSTAAGGAGKLGMQGLTMAAPLLMDQFGKQPTLQNLPKQNIPYQSYAYNQGRVNPYFGQPGNKDPYYLDQGYTRTAAQGGLLDSMEQNSYPQARLPLQHMAAGGVEGYATGDVVHAPAYQGPAGEASRFSRDIYSNAAGAGPNSDDPEEGPNSDSPGVGINTPAVGLPAIAKARADSMTLAQLQRAVEDADTAPEQAAALKRLQLVEAKLRPAKSTYTKAAHGGLMGMHEQTQEYAAGGMLLRGPGDGMSDSIPAVIKGAKPQRAALADGEFVIPADVVSHLGNGSTEAGAKRLYAMMDKVRHARTGNKKQGRQINPERFMPV